MNFALETYLDAREKEMAERDFLARLAVELNPLNVLIWEQI